jgi:hypothetical protein
MYHLIVFKSDKHQKKIAAEIHALIFDLQFRLLVNVYGRLTHKESEFEDFEFGVQYRILTPADQLSV